MDDRLARIETTLRELVDGQSRLKTELGQSLKAELGQSLKAELGQSLKAELGQSLKTELGQSLKTELGQSLKTELGQSLKTELAQSLRESLGAELRHQIGVLEEHLMERIEALVPNYQMVMDGMQRKLDALREEIGRKLDPVMQVVATHSIEIRELQQHTGLRPKTS